MFKRKKKKADKTNGTSLIRMVSARLYMVQRKWADWMHAKTRHWQSKQQRRFLFILCLVMGSFSTLSFLQLFKPSAETPASQRLTTPHPLPPLIHTPPERPMPIAADTTVFRRFRQHLDSLLQTPEGRKKYEQFLKERPGFMDSLVYAEKMIRKSFPHYNK